MENRRLLSLRRKDLVEAREIRKELIRRGSRADHLARCGDTSSEGIASTAWAEPNCDNIITVAWPSRSAIGLHAKQNVIGQDDED
jgi:hypothetical protein